MRTRWRDKTAPVQPEQDGFAFSHAPIRGVDKPLGNNAFAKIRATGHVRTRPLIERLTAFVSRALALVDSECNVWRWRGMRRRENETFRGFVLRNGSLRDCSRIKRKEKQSYGSRQASSIAHSVHVSRFLKTWQHPFCLLSISQNCRWIRVQSRTNVLY